MGKRKDTVGDGSITDYIPGILLGTLSVVLSIVLLYLFSSSSSESVSSTEYSGESSSSPLSFFSLPLSSLYTFHTRNGQKRESRLFD